jgi:hypothetical protein
MISTKKKSFVRSKNYVKVRDHIMASKKTQKAPSKKKKATKKPRPISNIGGGQGGFLTGMGTGDRG